MRSDPVFEERPWGNFEVLSDMPDHKVKRIVVRPGKRLSLQKHRLRSEHWHFVAGAGRVTIGEGLFAVKKGDSVDIPRGAVHRVENDNSSDLAFIEVQSGDYFGEDDIERIEDDFGRA